MKRLFKVEAKVRVAFAVATVVVVVIAMKTWSASRAEAEAAQQVEQTQEIIINLARTRADTVLVEITTQSFRLSGDPARIVERDAAIASREALIAAIRTQTADNPRQQANWQRLRQVLDERILISRRIENLRRDEGAAAANAYTATAPLQETRNRTAKILDAMDSEERRLLEIRNADQVTAREFMVMMTAIAASLLTTLLAATYVLIRRQLREIHASQRALAESEDSLATTLDSIGDAVIATDLQGRVLRMNPIAEQLTGWPFAEAKGRPIGEILDIVNEQTGLAAEIPVDRVLATGNIEELANHTVLISRKGDKTPITDSAAPIRDRDGDIHGVVMVFRDETVVREAQRTIQDQNLRLEQKVLERTEQLQQSESRLMSVINSVPARIAFIDPQQKYIYANRQYQEQFALAMSDMSNVAGRAVRDVLGDERYAIAAPLITRVLAGEPQSYDGQSEPDLWHAASYVPSWDALGQINGYYILGVDITQRRRAELTLQKKEQQLERVLQGSDQGYWDWNLKTNALQVSARWESMLGYGPGEMQIDPTHWSDHVHPEDFPMVMASIERHLAGQSELYEVEYRAKTRLGEWRWILSRGRVVERASDGTPLMMAGTHLDVTSRKQMEMEQRDAGIVFASSYEGIMVANVDGLITKVNPAFTRITGYAQAEAVGHSPRILSSGWHDARFFAQFWESLTERDFWHGEIWNRRKNGDLYAALQSVSVVRDSKGHVLHYVSVFADISQIKAHEAELDRVANYDPLTALPNRRLLSDRLTQATMRSDRTGKLAAVCFLDLDGFKSVNDRLGHDAGDQVLIGVAQQLKTVLRAEDTLARLGGDEFIVLLSEVSSAEECAQILERVQDAVRQPVAASGQVITISASIGVSLYPADNADPDTLLRHADQAMYLAKQAGKNRYQMFDPGIDRIAQAHRQALTEMEQALGQGEFVLFYQPKVDLVNGEVIGAEALIRWQHPQRGLLPPSEFLPHLNGSPLESEFGEWVIETALTRIQLWKAQGLRLKISVNISANHLLRADFTARLGQVLAKYPDVQPSDLELEVLETAAIQDMEQAVEILQRCMELGVRFSLDDFGTGYSSLTYLRKLPVDTLKIDQSFVRDMLSNPVDLGIVKGVIQLAGVFNRQVIAEGVETLEHGAALRKLGCHLVQGYGISRPMPADLMNAWCNDWQRAKKWQDL